MNLPTVEIEFHLNLVHVDYRIYYNSSTVRFILD